MQNFNSVERIIYYFYYRKFLLLKTSDNKQKLLEQLKLIVRFLSL